MTLIGWMYAHPVLTFFITFFAILLIDNAIGNICKTVYEVKKLKEGKDGDENGLNL